MNSYSLLLAAFFAGGAWGQATAWAQCGGSGWSGATTCVSGYTCVVENAWYSQCIPGTASSVTSASAPASPTSVPTATTLATSTVTSATARPSSTGTTGAFKWFGVDESCAEFGTAIPGTWGVDFTFASTSTIQTLMSQGYNIFRLPFMMERMAPSGLSAALSTAYLANYSVAVDYITANGGYAVLDPHNYGRYNGAIISDTTGFQTFWTNVATAFKNNSRVIFDTNNEYHDMDQTLVLNLNQAAIDGIRGAGATTQYIFAEGNSYTGAWTWNTTNTNLAALTDPQGLLVYEMHQYLDSDGSGTSSTCVSADIGVQRVEGATAWLRSAGKLGFLGEFAGGANSVCLGAVQGMLDHMKANSDVWLGAAWWAAGPWWASYIYSFEPPSGPAYVYYNSYLTAYTP